MHYSNIHLQRPTFKQLQLRKIILKYEYIKSDSTTYTHLNLSLKKHKFKHLI